MGGHYGTIHVRTEDAKIVRGALEELARELKKKFLLGPLVNGWMAVFPEDGGQDFEVSDALAKKVSAPLLHTMVHDDSLLAYHFHDGGKLIGNYNSCPDYFGESSEPRGGSVDLLQTILPDARRRDKLKELLDADDLTFEVERLQKFVDLLGLPNGVGSYEYLQDGERDGITQWKEFVHIPDVTAERNAKRAAKAKAKADMQQLVEGGLVILNVEGDKKIHPLFSSSPVWCIDATANDVVLAWRGSPVALAGHSKVSRVNVQTGDMVETGAHVSSHATCVAVSPDGVWLAAGCACGSWKTQICNLKTGRMVWEIPQSRAVEGVVFGRSGEVLYSLSRNIISVIDLDSGKVSDKISLPGGASMMLLHPDGEHLVAIWEGLIALVHLPSKKTLKSFWIKNTSGPISKLMELVKVSGWGAEILEKMPASVSPEEKEKIRLHMQRHFLPKQPVHSLSFGTLGNCLFCGGHDGVNVILWHKILAAQNMEALEPQAYIPAEQMSPEDGTSNNNLIYAMPIDSPRMRILFAGLEGKVKFVNVRDERKGDLLSPPIKRPFRQLELTPDRTALIGTGVPTRQGGRDKQCDVHFQIWNYKALCQAANLDW